MGFANDVMHKKDIGSITENNSVETSKNEHIGNAELMANVVAAGLESENYSDMNLQLANMPRDNAGKAVYVFEHPDVIGSFYGIALCILTSIVFAYLTFIGSATAYFSTAYHHIGLIIASVSGIFLLLNFYLISKFASTIKWKARYDIYNELLGFKSLEFIQDVALCSKQKELVVVKDLQRAIKQKLIPQGHFSRDESVFMVSDDVYARYMEKPAVYDRYFQQKLEERSRVSSRSEYISQVMESGERYITKLNDFRSLIKDKTVVRKIERMENVVSMIFHEIDINPDQVNSLGVFLNYYLPTTEKLLNTYVDITEKKIAVPNLSAAIKEIDETLTKIISSFEGILEKLYEEYEMDVSSEIEALELIMQKEGLSE